MLDVHPPHERVHGLGDFLLHLLTITIGLFIALSLESLVEWRHHVHLVHEARETLRGEIEHNLDRLQHELANLGQEQAEMDTNLATLRFLQEHPSASQPHGNLVMNFSSQDLDDTAWKTAQSTGALAYMPYTEAQRYADVYGSQADLRAAEHTILEDIARVQGLISRYDLPGNGKITPEAANALADEIGVVRTHLTFVHIAAESAAARAKALLEDKPPPRGFTEKLN